MTFTEGTSVLRFEPVEFAVDFPALDLEVKLTKVYNNFKIPTLGIGKTKIISFFLIHTGSFSYLKQTIDLVQTFF